jgi:hypothetical protein
MTSSLHQQGYQHNTSDENVSLHYCDDYDYRTNIQPLTPSSSFDDDDEEEEEDHPVAASGLDNGSLTSSSVSFPSLDLRKIYTSSFVQKSKVRRPRSVSSFTTECWSTTSTTEISNTTSFHQKKKQQKRRFFRFMTILMKLLERRNPKVYQNAQAVISDCELKKKKGETDSVVECLRAPLKNVVGHDYWYEARSMMYTTMIVTSNTATSTKINPTSSSNDADPFYLPDSAPGTTTSTSRQTPWQNKTKEPAISTKEESVRKKRLWIIICVMMKYLMRKDEPLYLKAKAIVRDCVHRHRNGDQKYRSLSKSIQTCLKNEIGITYWKRAESYVGKHLLTTDDFNPTTPHDDEDDDNNYTTKEDDDDLEPYPISGRKRSSDYIISSLSPNRKRKLFENII